MCDACVIEGVKRRMLSEPVSRRDLFRGAAAGGAALAASALPATAASHAAMPMSLQGAPVDLTHELHPGFPTFFGEPQFSMNQLFSFGTDGFNLFELTVNEHTGTHMDAPLHFAADGASVAEIPVSDLILPLAVIDIAEKAQDDPDAQVTSEDVTAWKEANGDMPEGCCVAMRSGWSSRIDDASFRGADPEGGLHFPGFHPEATAMLIEDGMARGMAVDTLSLDYGQSQDFATHYAWLPTGRWGLECVALNESLPPVGATIIVGAPKHRGGTGGPSRVMALAPAA